ncbi:MAG: FecR family protein [Acidobacteriaceae bacterium]
MLLKIQAAVSLFTCTCMLGATSVPAIGTVTTNGEVQVDGSAVRSNATLFNGSVLQATVVRSDVRLADGSKIVLNPGSRMTLYRDHAVLEQGLTLQRNAEKHAVVANGLRVSSENANGAVLVDVQDRTHMEVSARSGVADVRTPAGDLVARIEPGKALSFNTAPMESVSASSVKLAGILRPVANHFVLTDSMTGVTFQLQGPNLTQYSGMPVQVIGMLASVAPTAPGATRMVNVSEASPERDQSGNGPGAVSPASAPLIDGPTILFLTAVASVGVFLGLTASGTFGSGGPVSIP